MADDARAPSDSVLTARYRRVFRLYRLLFLGGMSIPFAGFMVALVLSPLAIRGAEDFHRYGVVVPGSVLQTKDCHRASSSDSTTLCDVTFRFTTLGGVVREIHGHDVNPSRFHCLDLSCDRLLVKYSTRTGRYTLYPDEGTTTDILFTFIFLLGVTPAILLYVGISMVRVARWPQLAVRAATNGIPWKGRLLIGRSRLGVRVAWFKADPPDGEAGRAALRRVPRMVGPFIDRLRSTLPLLPRWLARYGSNPPPEGRPLVVYLMGGQQFPPRDVWMPATARMEQARGPIVFEVDGIYLWPVRPLTRSMRRRLPSAIAPSAGGTPRGARA